MRRMFAFVFLPVVLFALEPVNLIKDGGFEKDSELWLERSEIHGPGSFDSTVYNSHDPDSAYIGNYCGSIDGRKRPAENLPRNYGVRGNFYQIITYPKKLKDLDSLELFHMCLFRTEGSKYSAWAYGTRLYFTRPSDGALIDVFYMYYVPNLTPAPDKPTYKGFRDTIASEGVWYGPKRDLKADLIGEKGLSEDIELDTFLLYEASYEYYGAWRSQKAFFDGVRLTGYADYDVGVKEILSGDSLREGHSYTPEARIKNFGRESADSFLVIAEIWDGESLIYEHTISHSLPGDTEDTLEFNPFTPESSGSYTLTIRTVMEPDESDEDDQLSKSLIYTGITEAPTTDLITLDVRSFTDPLCVSYSIPQGQQGTLTLYDAAGRKIKRLDVRGSGKVDFSSTLTSGVYFVRLETGQATVTRKAVVLK